MVTFIMVWLILCSLVAYVAWVEDEKLVIKDEEGPYLTRWHLVDLGFCKVFLHHIHRADKDRDLHNHPWPRAFAVVLRGGYYEQRGDQPPAAAFYYGPATDGPRINTLRPDTYHRITYVRPNTWTLFFAGRRSRDWGFLVDGKHVDYREYLGLPEDTNLGD